MSGRFALSFVFCCLFSLAGCATDVPGRWFSKASETGTSERKFDIQRLDMAVDAPRPDMPVTAGLHCLPSNGAASISDSQEFEVWVKVRIAEGFYLHAPDAEHPEMIPLKIALEQDDAVAITSDFQYPPGVRDENGFAIYRDEVLLGATIQVRESRSEAAMIKALLRYQACTTNSCRPPEETVLTQEIVLRPE